MAKDPDNGEGIDRETTGEGASTASGDLDEATDEARGTGADDESGEAASAGDTTSSGNEAGNEADNEAGNEADDAGGISEPETDDTAEAGSGQEGRDSFRENAAGAGGNEEGSGKSFNGFYGGIFR